MSPQDRATNQPRAFTPRSGHLLRPPAKSSEQLAPASRRGLEWCQDPELHLALSLRRVASESYELGASTLFASLALTAFWGMVTVGRVVFASAQRRLPTYQTYWLLPFVLAGSLVLISTLPAGSDIAGVLAFGLAGLGCSALLPLTISFGQEQLVTMSASAAGAVIACYQVGDGIAAFGTGPLQDAGVTLPALFAMAAGVAVAMGLLSFVLTSHRTVAS